MNRQIYALTWPARRTYRRQTAHAQQHPSSTPSLQLGLPGSNKALLAHGSIRAWRQGCRDQLLTYRAYFPKSSMMTPHLASPLGLSLHRDDMLAQMPSTSIINACIAPFTAAICTSTSEHSPHASRQAPRSLKTVQ